MVVMRMFEVGTVSLHNAWRKSATLPGALDDDMRVAMGAGRRIEQVGAEGQDAVVRGGVVVAGHGEVLETIVENGVTERLPLRGSSKARLPIARIHVEELDTLRSEERRVGEET